MSPVAVTLTSYTQQYRYRQYFSKVLLTTLSKILKSKVRIGYAQQITLMCSRSDRCSHQVSTISTMLISMSKFNKSHKRCPIPQLEQNPCGRQLVSVISVLIFQFQFQLSFAYYFSVSVFNEFLFKLLILTTSVVFVLVLSTRVH